MWNFPHSYFFWQVPKVIARLSINCRLLKTQTSDCPGSTAVPLGMWISWERWKPMHCTAGHEGSVADISCMSIFSACFGLLTSVQLAATTWSGQIWISCWILPHFDVRTISVAWKLKKLSNIFWQKIFFLLNPLSKGVAPLCSGPPGPRSSAPARREAVCKQSAFWLSASFLCVGPCLEAPDQPGQQSEDISDRYK